MIANVCLQAVFWEIQDSVSSTLLFYGIMVASTKLNIGIFFYQGHTCLEETHIEDAFFLLQMRLPHLVSATIVFPQIQLERKADCNLIQHKMESILQDIYILL